MSIDITSEPATPVIATRPVRMVLTSDTSDIVHIIAVPNIDGTAYPAMTILPDMADFFNLDLSQYLQDALTAKMKANGYNLADIGTGSIATEAGMLVAYYVDLWEEIDPPTGPYVTAYPGTEDLQSVTKYALNATRQHTETLTLSDHIAGSSSKRFFTNAPGNKTVGINDHEMLYIYTSLLAHFAKLVINTYSSAGVLLDTFETAYTSAAHTIVSSPIGPANIMEREGASAMDNVASYTVTVHNNNIPASGASSETRTYYVDRDARNVRKRFHWINRFGAIDSYTFTGDYVQSLKTSRTTYRSSLPAGFASRDKGLHTLSSSAVYEHSVSSSYERLEVVRWLHEILTSPGIWLEENSQYVPVQVTSTDSLVEDVKEALPVFRFSYVFSNDIETQRG